MTSNSASDLQVTTVAAVMEGVDAAGEVVVIASITALRGRG